MTQPLSAKLFEPHLNSVFTFTVPDSSEPTVEKVNGVFQEVFKNGAQADLTLTEVSKEKPCGPFISFHLIFRGPAVPFLPQGSYAAKHAGHGDRNFFIVPIGDIKNENQEVTGYDYQVCYSVKPAEE